MNEVSINKDVKLSPHLALPSVAALSHLSELNGVHLSPHFTLGELCKTSYHPLDGNIPSHVAIENLTRLCLWLELLREEYNRRYEESEEIPVVITSGYRSEEVNRLCGGAKGSNHLTGCAVDIRCMGPEHQIRMASILLDIADGTKRDLTSSRVCSHSAESMQASLCARSNADFDELILEKRGSTRWIHFAVRPSENRRKILFDMR